LRTPSCQGYYWTWDRKRPMAVHNCSIQPHPDSQRPQASCASPAPGNCAVTGTRHEEARTSGFEPRGIKGELVVCPSSAHLATLSGPSMACERANWDLTSGLPSCLPLLSQKTTRGQNWLRAPVADSDEAVDVRPSTPVPEGSLKPGPLSPATAVRPRWSRLRGTVHDGYPQQVRLPNSGP